MKKLLVAGIAAAAFCGAPALAADIPTKAPAYQAATPLFDWSGFYIGGTLGYGWGRAHHSQAGGSTDEFNTHGLVGGGTLGYNRQSGRVVLGIETDISYSGVKGDTNFTGGFGAFHCTPGPCETRVNWFGTARGRIGYAFDQLLPYITGGFAYGRVHADISGSQGFGFDGSSTKGGWTAGAGMEWAINPQWSAKLEYLYVDLGDLTYGQAGTLGDGAKSSGRFNLVRAGINYRFGWMGKSPVVAKY